VTKKGFLFGETAMKLWHDGDGEAFKNSDKCFGREYNPGSGTIDVAKISIRGRFPEKGWGWLEDIHEMAIITNGSGYALAKDGERFELQAGDVLYIEPGRRWCWGGSFDMIVPCGPAFEPGKHHLEEG
jgi:hypothetical protein